jgi:hypothetical protein
MSVQIFPESVETSECTICYDLNVELVPVCNNKHNICKNCVNRIKNKKCPFCRTEIEADVIDVVDVVDVIESQPQEEQMRPRNTTQQESECSRAVLIIQFLTVLTLFLILILNFDTFNQTEKALFVVVLSLMICGIYVSFYLKFRFIPLFL